jgi:hypothetical protein
MIARTVKLSIACRPQSAGSELNQRGFRRDLRRRGSQQHDRRLLLLGRDDAGSSISSAYDRRLVLRPETPALRGALKH